MTLRMSRAELRLILSTPLFASLRLFSAGRPKALSSHIGSEPSACPFVTDPLRAWLSQQTLYMPSPFPARLAVRLPPFLSPRRMAAPSRPRSPSASSPRTGLKV
eukprot:230114-Chlamydomonas_euryale.AAC.1